MKNGADLLVDGLARWGVTASFWDAGFPLDGDLRCDQPGRLDPHDLDPQRASRCLRRRWLCAGDGAARGRLHDRRARARPTP